MGLLAGDLPAARSEIGHLMLEDGERPLHPMPVLVTDAMGQFEVFFELHFPPGTLVRANGVAANVVALHKLILKRTSQPSAGMDRPRRPDSKFSVTSAAVSCCLSRLEDFGVRNQRKLRPREAASRSIRQIRPF